MNTVTINPNGTASCSCGAKASKSEVTRFKKRHPSLCSERRQIAKDLSQGTRSVDEDEARAQRWDAIENALRAERGMPSMEEEEARERQGRPVFGRRQ